MPNEDTLEGLLTSLWCSPFSQVIKRSGQLLLRLGDTDVPYSEEFRFFVTTKLANPHYMPEICIKVGKYQFVAFRHTQLPLDSSICPNYG